MPEQAGRAPLQSLHQLVDAKLGINLAEKMHVVMPDLKFDDFGLKLLCLLMQDPFQAQVYAVGQHFASVPRIPDDMVFAGIDDIAIALV